MQSTGFSSCGTHRGFPSSASSESRITQISSAARFSVPAHCSRTRLSYNDFASVIVTIVRSESSRLTIALSLNSRFSSSRFLAW